MSNVPELKTSFADTVRKKRESEEYKSYYGISDEPAPTYTDEYLGYLAQKVITRRVNNWIEDSNKFLTDSNNRYSLRKFNYEDDYVNDSEEFVKNSSDRSNELDASKNSIFDYVANYRQYLDDDYVENIEGIFAGEQTKHKNIIDIASSDNDYWLKFAPNEEQTANGYTSEQIYGEWQQYQRDLVFDIEAGEKELDALKKEREDAENNYHDPMEKYKNLGVVSPNVDWWISPGYDPASQPWKDIVKNKEPEQNQASYSPYRYEIVSEEDREFEQRERERQEYEKYGYVNPLRSYQNPFPEAAQDENSTRVAWKGQKSYVLAQYDKLIADLEAQIARAKENQEYQAQYEFFDSYTRMDDFDTKSQYESTYRGGEEFNYVSGTYTDTGYDDIIYDYINGDETARSRQELNWSQSNATFLGLDASYLKEMTEYEVSIYNYLYESGHTDAANQYLDFLLSDLTYRKRKNEEAYYAAYAKEHPVLASGFSVLTSPLKVLSALGQVADYSADGEINQNAGYNKFSYIPSAIRSEVSNQILKSGEWGEVGSWGYNLGMSMGDFLMTTAVSGGNSYISLALMGSGAMADTVISAKDRGLSDGQAFTLGVVAAGAEIITEKFSLDALFKGGLEKGAVKYILVNAFTEGTEEVSSSLINLFADIIVSKDKSQWQMSINEYLEKNPDATESEAFNKVLTDTALSLGLDFLGGSLMGGVMGSGGAATNYLTNAAPYLQKNKDALAKYGNQTDALIQEGLESDKDTDSYYFAQKYQQQVQGKDGKEGKALTGYQIRTLLSANQEQITTKDMQKIEKAAENRLRSLGQKENVRYIAELATKRATGQKLTRTEKSILANSQYGSRVANELLPENILSGGYSSEWAEDIGTKQVNATAYNKKALVREIVEAMSEDPTVYKSLESRTGEEKVAEYDVGTAISVLESNAKSGDNSKTDAKIETDTVKNATQVSTGEKITIKNVAKIDNGKVTYNTDKGEIDASDVDIESVGTDLLWRSAVDIKGIDAEGANSIIHAYTSNTTVTSYFMGAAQEFKNGMYNMKSGSGQFASKLTDVQRSIIYEAGQNAAERIRATKNETHEQIRKKASEQKTKSKPKNLTISYDKGNGEVVSIKEAGVLTEKQEAAVRIARVLHKLGLGTRIEFYSSYLSETLKTKDGEKARVYLDENGNEQLAPAGVYKKADGTIRVDLKAYNGRNLALYSLAHELTHFIQQWSDEKYQLLADFLVKTYDDSGLSMRDRVLAHQQFLETIRGEEVSFDEAFKEVVANAMMMMFNDGKLVERLTELKALDKNLFQKLWERIKEIIGKFLDIYKDEGALFRDTADIMQMKETFEQLQNMFAEALVEASENYQASLTPGVEGIVVSKTGEPVAHSTGDGTVQLSMHTYETEGRDVFRDYLEKCVSSKKLTKAEMTEMLDGIEEIYQTCKEFKDKYAPFSTWSDAAVVRDTHGRPVFSVVTPNGDYKMNLDFSLVCKKRRTLDAVFNEMSKRGIIDDFELGQKSVVKINEIIRKYGLETACALCFVDAKRFRQASMADSFTRLYNELVESLVPEDQKSSISHFNFSGYETIKQVENGIDTWDNSKLDFSHINHVLKTYSNKSVEYKTAKYIKTHAEGRKLLLRGDFMSSKGFDAVKTQNPDVLKLYNSKKGTGGPKAAFGDVQYMNEVIQKARWWTPEKAFSVGGIRVQSFSDYVPRMVFDYVQMIYDLAATKLPAHAYTKEALFVKQFGLTGIKINMSLIPAIAEGGIAPGLDANGNYVWAGESFDYDTAKEIQNAEGYTENCGTICVGVSKEHILKLLRDPNIRMVIPYHKSGLNPIVAHMNKIAEFHDYTNDQRTKGKDGRALDKDFDFNKVLHDMGENANPKAVADQYLKWCAANGYTPRFAEFAMEENYYKLLEDFTLYDKDGKYVPQRAVKATFPTEGSAFGSMKSLIESGLQEDAVIEGKRDKSLSAIVDEIQENLPKTEAEIEETQVEQADRDLEQYSSQETDIDRTYIDYGDIASEKASIDKTVAKLVAEGKFVEVTADEVDVHRASAKWDIRKKARLHLKKILKAFLGKSVYFNRNGVKAEAYLTKDGFNHSGVGLNTPEKAAAFSKYYALIANAEYSYSSKNDIHSNANTRIGGKIDWDSFVSVAMVAGEPYPVVFKVRTIDKDIRSQIYRMATKNEIGSTHDYGQQEDLPDALPNYGGTPTSGGKVTHPDSKVKKNSGKELQSSQETEYSNRDLLANAFEGITKSSSEYKLVQEYKGHVRLLNEYDQKLDEVNAEIHKMRFTKGHDTAKLKELEAKAKNLAKEISRHDKELLSLEASEPLRKLIEQERKTASRETIEHVNQIMQNKKDRAEQTELRHKIREAVRDLDKILNRGNKKQNVKEDMKGFASKALELAEYLFADHISNDDLIRKGITVRMTPREAALVEETNDILSQLYDNADSLTDDEFTRLDEKRKENEYKLRNLLTAQRNEYLGTPVYKLFNDLCTEYGKLKNANQDAVKGAYDPNVERFLRSYIGVADGEVDSNRVTLLQNMRVADMTTEELWELHNAYTMVLHSVRNANKLFVKGKTETIDQIKSRISDDFSDRKISDSKISVASRKLSNKFGWNYEKLYYALDRIGSEAFTELFENLANSENIVMQDVVEAVLFRDQIIEKYNANDWNFDKKLKKVFVDNTGKKFRLTLGELMALYAYYRRENAWNNIEYGGFTFGEEELTDPNPADTYKLTKKQGEAIIGLLTKEQKGYVEEMQKFLSETMGEKGNEVSLMLYGIKLFTDPNYFPKHIYGAFKAKVDEANAKNEAGFLSMSNAGFTHAMNPNAKAPIVLEGFNQVWADHVNEMSRYHGTVPALEDIRRVMNSSVDVDSMSIKQLMKNKFGDNALKYFDNLYREANSGAITDKLQKPSHKLLSLFRKNYVAYSLSVLIQQPASIIRAYAMIDRKYFGAKGFGAITSGIIGSFGDSYSEMLKYAPGVTMAKEIGGFDTATGGSIRSYLMDTNKSFVQKINTDKHGKIIGAAKALASKVDDNFVANLPNYADKVAWIAIWDACKRETLAKNKAMSPKSEEFMKIVGERFTEVIRATQVYDSIFAKSPMLKSKNLAVQYLVSFMNEPNVIANMVEKAMRDIGKGNFKSGAKGIFVVIHSIIFTNLLKSIIAAMRDDDDDETYTEKYVEAFTGNMMSDFNPFSYIPIARDVWSIAQGYDVERADMAIVADALDALDQVIKYAVTDTDEMTEDQLAEFEEKQTEATWKLVESLAAFIGIPVKNIRREANAFIDHARIASKNAGKTTSASVWSKVYDSVMDSIPFLKADSQQDKLYTAIIDGDVETAERIKSSYTDDDGNFSQSKYDTAIRKALRENDSRIKEAAEARYSGDFVRYKELFDEMKAEGRFETYIIKGAIDAEENELIKRNKKDTTKKDRESDTYEASFDVSNYYTAVINDDKASMDMIYEDLINDKLAEGYLRHEAEDQIANSFAEQVGKAYKAGEITSEYATQLLKQHTEKDQKEVKKWDFEVEHGFSWSARVRKYRLGLLSEQDLIKAVMNVEGSTRAEAVEYIRFLDLEKSNGNIDITANDAAGYFEYAQPAGISINVYLTYTSKASKCESDKDANGKPINGSYKAKVMAVIDSLPITNAQKDALYIANGWSEDKIKDAPWHKKNIH